jgi:putative hemolysin
MPNDLLIALVILVLLLVAGLFSAAEISLLALGRHRARRLSTGLTGALTERLLSRPTVTLGTMLVLITALNYSSEAMAADLAVTHGLPVWVAILAVVMLVMVFAEAVPISYAVANVERVARATVVPIWIASGLLWVPTRAMGLMAEGLVWLLGGRPRPEEPVTEQEIRAIVDLQAEAGALEEEEKAMIHHIFEFGDKAAREVMVPRTAMVAIPETGTAREAGKLATEHRISRLPAYRQDLDDIVGVVYVKDVLPLLATGGGEVSVTEVMRPALRVPETRRLSDLMTDFRRNRRTFAIVVDEYGGTAGLVTLEDLLEEVVGDIYDEYDVVRPLVQRLEGGTIALDGRMSISEASAALGLPLPEGDYDSLAGLLYSRLGVVPRVGQALDLHGVRLIVDERQGYRISRVLAVRKPQAGEAGKEPRQGGGE